MESKILHRKLLTRTWILIECGSNEADGSFTFPGCLGSHAHLPHVTRAKSQSSWMYMAQSESIQKDFLKILLCLLYRSMCMLVQAHTFNVTVQQFCPMWQNDSIVQTHITNNIDNQLDATITVY
jgi:hypothetical protein